MPLHTNRFSLLASSHRPETSPIGLILSFRAKADSNKNVWNSVLQICPAASETDRKPRILVVSVYKIDSAGKLATIQTMDAKEFRTALFKEYSINETHAVRIIETCYGGPANWSSIEWTKDETVTNNTTPGANNWWIVENAHDPVAQKTTEVLGMSIFWILFLLCLACVYHPLASSIHNLSRFRRYLHVSPFFCLIDSVYIIIQVWAVRAQGSIPRRRAIEVVVKHRLREFLSLPVAQGESGDEMRELPTVEGNGEVLSTAGTAPEQQSTLHGILSEPTPEDPSTNSTSSTLSRPTISGESLAPTSVVARAALNAYVRIIANVGVVLVYTKICGFSGIRPCRSWRTYSSTLG